MKENDNNVSTDEKQSNDKKTKIIVTPVYVGDKPMEEVFADVISGNIGKGTSAD